MDIIPDTSTNGTNNMPAEKTIVDKKRKLPVALLVCVVLLVLTIFVGLLVWRYYHAQQDTMSGVLQHQADQVPQTPTTSSLPQGSKAYSLISGGITRTYRVYVPQNLSGSIPLVVMMHGGGGSAVNAEKTYGWDQQADKGKFIVAFPDGLGDSISAWNVDGSGDSNNPCCGYPARQDINDVQFIQDMVTKIQSEASIDKRRIYATGMSNGAMLSYTLACETDIFAAIGTVSGTLLNKCTSPHPISVIDIHGMLDTHVRYDGQPGEGTGKIDGPSIPDVDRFWRGIDRCDAPSLVTVDSVTSSTASCPGNREVKYIAVASAGHTWPSKDADPNKTKRDGTQQSDAIDSTTVIWQFFTAHPKE